jgi:hypothetical protein
MKRTQVIEEVADLAGTTEAAPTEAVAETEATPAEATADTPAAVAPPPAPAPERLLAPGAWQPVPSSVWGTEPYELTSAYGATTQEAILRFRTAQVERDRRSELAFNPARQEIREELRKQLADPESALSRTRRYEAERQAVSKTLEVAQARVTELEAKRALLVAEAPKGMAARLVTIDRDLSAARDALSERQAEAAAIAGLADGARAEAEGQVADLANRRGAFHMDDLRRRLREKLEELATRIAPDLEELAGMYRSLALRFNARERQQVAAGLLDEVFGLKS